MNIGRKVTLESPHNRANIALILTLINRLILVFV